MTDMPDDDVLLAAARAAHDELDPPPERLREAAIRAAAWDHEMDLLVSLGHDSQFADAGLRAATAPRDLVFESGEISIELVVEPTERDPAITVVRGEIDPVPDRVIARSPDRPDLVVDLDEAGRFEVETDAIVVRIVAEIDGREVGTEVVTLFE